MTAASDTFLVYVGQQVIDRETTLPPAITGCFEIVSDVSEGTERIFSSPLNVGRGRGRGRGQGTGDEVFPLRVRLRAVEIFDPPVSFKPLIPKLAFITNKKQWSGHTRGQAMRMIPEEDYLYIMKAAETPRG